MDKMKETILKFQKQAESRMHPTDTSCYQSEGKYIYEKSYGLKTFWVTLEIVYSIP